MPLSLNNNRGCIYSGRMNRVKMFQRGSVVLLLFPGVSNYIHFVVRGALRVMGLIVRGNLALWD